MTQPVEKINALPRDIKPISPDYFTPNRFKNKTILITGGSRGIGKATAIRAAREGANVVIADFLETEGQATLHEINKLNGIACFIQTDVRQNEDCKAMVDRAVSEYGSLDLVLNAAGVMDGISPSDTFDLGKQRDLIFAPIHEASDEYWDQVMGVNITGLFKSMRYELRQLLRQNNGGAIVNIGSIASLIGLAGNPAYVASKHSVAGLTRNAAIDYAPFGIRVNSVNMAGTETPMTDAAYKKVMKLEEEKALSGAGGPQIPNTAFAKAMSLLAICDSKNRMATPYEQAAIILLLLSDESSNITGANWATDGGWTAF